MNKPVFTLGHFNHSYGCVSSYSPEMLLVAAGGTEVAQESYPSPTRAAACLAACQESAVNVAYDVCCKIDYEVTPARCYSYQHGNFSIVQDISPVQPSSVESNKHIWAARIRGTVSSAATLACSGVRQFDHTPTHTHTHLPPTHMLSNTPPPPPHTHTHTRAHQPSRHPDAYTATTHTHARRAPPGASTWHTQPLRTHPVRAHNNRAQCT